MQHEDNEKTNVDLITTRDDGKNDIKKVAKQRKTESRVKKYHPADVIIRDIIKARRTRGKRHVDYQEMAGMIIFT